MALIRTNTFSKPISIISTAIRIIFTATQNTPLCSRLLSQMPVVHCQ
jgi:hypothetical protein